MACVLPCFGKTLDNNGHELSRGILIDKTSLERSGIWGSVSPNTGAEILVKNKAKTTAKISFLRFAFKKEFISIYPDFSILKSCT